MFHAPPLSAHLPEGRVLGIEVALEDPLVPGPGERVHPSLRRALQEQRSVFSTFLAARRAHVDEHGMDVRVERGWEPVLGWVLPEPPPGVAITGDVASIAGWYVLVLRAAVGSFELSAPVWWGPRERTPELGRARGEAVGAPDGTVRVRISLRRPV